MTAELTALVRDIPDFPAPGIVFKDITPLLADGPAFRAAIEGMAALVDGAGKVEFRNVKVGPRVDTLWVIDEGLKPGDRVIVEGLQRVKAGDTVNAKPMPAGGDAATPAREGK